MTRRIGMGVAALALASAAPASGQQPSPPARATLRVCVVQNGGLAEVEAAYLPPDTIMIRGGAEVPFSRVHSAADTTSYAERTRWYADGHNLRMGSRLYRVYGVPRFIPIFHLERVSSVNRIPIFAQVGSPRPPEVIFVPVSPGCIFQTYADSAAGGGAADRDGDPAPAADAEPARQTAAIEPAPPGARPRAPRGDPRDRPGMPIDPRTGIITQRPENR